MSEEEGKKEEPKLLTEQEIEEYSKLDYEGQKRLSLYGELGEKFKNTIQALEEDLQKTEGIERFIHEGVLVNDQIILSCHPDEYGFRRGMLMRVLGQLEGSITVELNLEDARRLLKLLPAMIEASNKAVQLRKLKEIVKDKGSRRW